MPTASSVSAILILPMGYGMEPIFCLKLVWYNALLGIIEWLGIVVVLLVQVTCDSMHLPFSAGYFSEGHHTPTQEGELQRCLHRLWVDGHWSSSPSTIEPATNWWSLSGTMFCRPRRSSPRGTHKFLVSFVSCFCFVFLFFSFSHRHLVATPRLHLAVWLS